MSECKLMEREASAFDKRIKHNIKMEAKKILRKRAYDNRANPSYIACNLGRNHPDYGMSWEDHQAEKAIRNAEKSS